MLGEHPETPIHFDPSDDDNLLDEHSEVPIHSDQRKSAGSIALEVFPEAIPLPNADEMLDGHLETSINFEPSDNDNLLDEHPEVPIRSDQRKSAGSIAVEVFPEAIPLPSDDDNLLDEHFPISVLIGQPGSIGDAFREDSAGAHVQERPSVATEPYNRSQNRPIQTEQDDVDDFLAASSKKKSKKSRKSRKGSAAETSKSTEAGEEIASQPLVTPGAVEDEKRNIALDESTKAASRVESAGVEDDLVGLSNKKKGKKGKKQILKIKDLELDGRKLEQTEPPSVPIETPEAAGADTSSSIATSKAVEHEQGTKQIVEPEFGAFQKDSDVVEDEWSGFSTKRKDKKGKKQKSKTLDLDQEREESDKFQAHAVLRDEANHPLSEALTNASPVSAVLGLNKPYASFTKDSKEEFADDNNAEHGQQEPLGDQHPSIDGISVVKEPESSTLEIKPKTADPYETSDSFPSSAATTDTARDVQVIIADKNAKQSYTQHGVEAVMAPLATEDRSADKPTKEEESELGPLKLKRRGKKQKQGKTPTLSESTVNDSAKHVEVGTPLEPQPAFEAVENLLPRNSERDKKSKKKDVSETANESRDAVDLNGSVAAALQEDNDTSSMGREIISSANTAVSGGGEAFVSQQNISATNAHESDDLRRSPPDQELDAILSRTKKQKKKSKKSKAFSLNDDIVPVPDGQPIVGNREIEGGEFGQATASKNVIEESGNVADNDIGSDKDTKKSKKSKPSSLADEVASIREDEPAIVGRDVENKASEHTLPSDDTVKEPGPTIDYRIQNKKDRKKAKKERLLQWENEHIAEGETTRELGETTSENATISSADPDIVQEERTPSLQEPSDSSRTAALFETALFNATSPAAFLEQRTSIPDYPRFGQEQVSRIDVVNNSGANVVSAYGLEKNKKEKKKAKKAKKAQISTWDEGQIPQESKAGAEELSAAENNTDEPLIISIPQDLEGGPKQQRSTEEIEPTEVVRPGDWPQKVYEHERNDPYREPGESGDAQIRSVDDEQMEGSKSFNDNYENERSTKEIFSTFEFEKNKAVVEEGIAQVTSYGPGDDRPSSQQCRADDIQVPGVNQVSVGHPTSVLDLEHISPHVNTSVVARVKEKATDEFRDIQMRKGGNETSHRKEPWGDEPEFLDSASRADSDPSQGTIEVAPLSEPTTQVSASGNAETKNLFPAVEVEMLDAQEQREYNDEYAKELKRQLSPMQRGDDANLLREETDPSMFTQQNIEATIAPQLNDEHRSFARAPDLEDIIEESRSGPGSVQEIPVSRGDDSSTSKPTKKSKKSKKAKEQQPTAWEDDTATPPLVEKHERDVNTFLDPSAVTRSWDDEAPAQPLNLKEPIEQRTVEAKSSTSLRKGFTITTDGESPTRKPESEDRFGIRLRTGAKEDVGRTLEDEHQCSFVTESPHFTTDQPSIPGMWAEPADDTKDHKKQDSSHDERFKPDPADYQDRSNTESLPVKEQAVEDVVLAPTKKSKKGKKSKIKDSIRQPNPQVLGWEEDVDQSRSAEIPTAGPTVEALPEMPPSRELSPRPTPHLEDERFSSAKVPPASAPMSTSMEEGFAAAAGLVSLEADGLAKRSFKKGAKKSKKAAKISTATVLKDNTLERGNAPHEEDISNESEEQRLPLKHGGGVGAGQQFHESAPQSPPSPGYEVIKDRPKIQNQDQPLQSSQDRYSAIHASDSPVISEETSVHRAIRDSGYPETEASHTANEELPGEPSRHEQDDNFHQLVEHPEKRLNWDDESHENPRSTSRNEVNISAGVQSSSNVSTTTPNERSQRSRRRSGAAYDSDDSADSGFDVQRRRRRQAKVGETREPSPVSLTTKDRSPALFDSSPSAMVEAVDRPQDDERPSYESRREEPTWSFGHEDVPGEETADTLKGDEFNEARGLAAYSESTSNYEGTRESLFGGPESYDDAMVSPPRSPFGSESLGHQRLNTISEENLELHKKDMHNASAGSPDLGIKVEQMQSPPDTKDTVKGCISTDDLISRQAWPAVEKDRQWVDIERSRGGKADHSSSIQSFRARQGEGEVGQRAASRVSMQSETRDRDNSIHAIIRTPEQVRSASGQSYRSSGTPPLRRVDRSASGDLRGASKKSEAKSRAKIKTFSDNEAEAEDHISIASSSTYDPVTVTDKGKSRADMANVYVSLHITYHLYP